MQYRFKRRWEKDTGWIQAPYNFDTYIDQVKRKTESLDALGKDWYIIVKHWLYKASCAPVMDYYWDFADFNEKLTKENYFSAGDVIQCWVISEDDSIFNAKCPDEQDLIPEKGSY